MQAESKKLAVADTATDIIVAQAVRQLALGELVILPTDTVYGIAAAADQPQAVEKLFVAKKRQRNRALVIVVADTREVEQWAVNPSSLGQQLMQDYWPGALTLVLPKLPTVSAQISGGANSIGLRCPDHDLVRTIVRTYAKGVVLTSANLSASMPALELADLAPELSRAVALIVDDGRCQSEQASTVVAVNNHKIKVLRQGHLILPDQ